MRQGSLVALSESYFSIYLLSKQFQSQYALIYMRAVNEAVTDLSVL